MIDTMLEWNLIIPAVQAAAVLVAVAAAWLAVDPAANTRPAHVRALRPVMGTITLLMVAVVFGAHIANTILWGTP